MTTTRRAMLAGVAALPALSLPAVASNDPDAPLHELDHELDDRFHEAGVAGT